MAIRKWGDSWKQTGNMLQIFSWCICFWENYHGVTIGLLYTASLCNMYNMCSTSNCNTVTGIICFGCGTVYRGWCGTVYLGWFQPRYTQNQKTQNSRASDWSSQSVPRLKLSVVHCTAWAVVHWTASALVHCTASAMVHCTMSAAVQCIEVDFSWFQPRYTVPRPMQYTVPPPKQKIPMTEYCA